MMKCDILCFVCVVVVSVAKVVKKRKTTKKTERIQNKKSELLKEDKKSPHAFRNEWGGKRNEKTL